MKLRNFAIVFLIFMILDDLIQLAFPVDFQYVSYSFVPHFTFVSMLLLIHDMKWLDRTLVAGLCGLVTDMFFTSSMPLYMILYALSGYGIGFLSKFMENDVRITFFVVFGFVFLIDCIPMTFCILFDIVNGSWLTWFIHSELLTLVLHIIVIVGMMYGIDVYKRYMIIKENRKKRKDILRYRV